MLNDVKATVLEVTAIVAALIGLFAMFNLLLGSLDKALKRVRTVVVTWNKLLPKADPPSGNPPREDAASDLNWITKRNRKNRLIVSGILLLTVVHLTPLLFDTTPASKREVVLVTTEIALVTTILMLYVALRTTQLIFESNDILSRVVDGLRDTQQLIRAVVKDQTATKK